jgi:hypothetical protein
LGGFLDSRKPRR